MSRPSKMTPAKIGRLREALGRGESLRSAAEAAGIPFETARRWSKRAPSKATRATASTPPRKAPRASRPETGRRASVPPPAAEIDAVLSAPPPDTHAEARDRLALIRGLLERLTPAVEREEFPATSYVTIARYADELTRFLAELTPPPPPDPSTDPANLEAKRLLLATIEGLVSNAEAQP